MIPANGTYYVHFNNPAGQFTRAMPVIAWDDDGSPLIAGKFGLISAADSGLGAVRGIKHDTEAAVGAVPGGGGVIDCVDDEGTTWTTPILAWVIHGNGTATPITSDVDGVTGDATDGLEKYRIRHPDATHILLDIGEQTPAQP
jgi:hypothetical protein